MDDKPLDEKLFEGNEFLNELAGVMGKTHTEVLSLLSQCRTDTAQVTAASSSAAPPPATSAGAIVRAAPLESERIPTPRYVQMEMQRLEKLLPDVVFEDFDTMMKIQKALAMRDVISFRLPPKGAIEGTLLREAMAIVSELAKTSYFKIGLSTDPCYRFCNESYGYMHYADAKYGKRFARMIVLCGTDSAQVAGLLEASLIALSAESAHCCNVARGGEAKSKNASFFFVYVVCSCGKGRRALRAADMHVSERCALTCMCGSAAR